MRKSVKSNSHTRLSKAITRLHEALSNSNNQLSKSELNEVLNELEDYRKLLDKEDKNTDNPTGLTDSPNEGDGYFREIINHMNDTVWVIGFNGKFLNCNQRAVDLLGYSKEEILTMGPVDIDEKLLKDNIQKLIASMPQDGAQVFETEHIAKSGMKIPVEISSSLFNYKGEQVILSIARDLSDRKKTEKKLKISKERYYRIFEATGTATLIVNEDTTIALANKECHYVTGFKPEELIGNKWTNYVAKESLEEMMKYHLLRREYPELAPKKYEVKLIHRSGEIKNALLDIAMMPDIKQSIVSILDITERKKAEDELLKSEKFLKETQKIARLGTYTFNIKNGNWECSPILDEIFGIDENFDKSVQGWISIAHPEWQEGLSDYYYNEVISGKKNFNREYKIIRQDDDVVRWVHVLGELRFNNKGEIVNLIGTVHDITDRKETESILMLSQLRLDEAMKIANLGTWELNVDKGEFIFNDQFYKLLHTSAEKEGGYNMPAQQYAEKFLHPDDKPLVEIESRKAMETKNPDYFSRLDHRIIYTDGGTGYFNVNIRIKKDENGKTKKVYGVNQDITERKKAEEELRIYKEHLEELVKERTAEIEEQKNELERYNKLFEGREFRIHELREKVKELEKKLADQ